MIIKHFKTKSVIFQKRQSHAELLIMIPTSASNGADFYCYRVPTAGLQCLLERASCPSNSHCWNRQVFPLPSHPQNHNQKVFHQLHTKVLWELGRSLCFLYNMGLLWFFLS